MPKTPILFEVFEKCMNLDRLKINMHAHTQSYTKSVRNNVVIKWHFKEGK